MSYQPNSHKGTARNPICYREDQGGDEGMRAQCHGEHKLRHNRLQGKQHHRRHKANQERNQTGIFTRWGVRGNVSSAQGGGQDFQEFKVQKSV